MFAILGVFSWLLIFSMIEHKCSVNLLLGVHRLRQQQRAGEQRDDEQAQQTLI